MREAGPGSRRGIVTGENKGEFILRTKEASPEKTGSMVRAGP